MDIDFNQIPLDDLSALGSYLSSYSGSSFDRGYLDTGLTDDKFCDVKIGTPTFGTVLLIQLTLICPRE